MWTETLDAYDPNFQSLDPNLVQVHLFILQQNNMYLDILLKLVLPILTLEWPCS